MFLSLAVALLSWTGWMHERSDKLERIAAMQADVLYTRGTLQGLVEAQRQGPRHTACDTKQILMDLRARGIKLPAYPVEDRCK